MSDLQNHQLVTYIDQHIQEEISLESISRAFGYSKYHFSRIFQEKMSVSVTGYITKRKLTVSVEDILQGKRILDVALKYGWQSHSSYTKSFRREFGISPSEIKSMCLTIADFGGGVMSEMNVRMTKGMETKEELVEILLETMEKNSIAYHEEFVQMIAYSLEVYAGLQRYSGEDYVSHPLNVAIILAQVEADVSTIGAGLFCDAHRKGRIVEQQKLPTSVADILQGISCGEAEKTTNEVLLIRMAERLHNMRTIEYMPEKKRKEKAMETINSFLPMARRLDNHRLLEEINSLAIAYVGK